MNHEYPDATLAADAASRTKPSNYPEPFASRMSGRVKRPLGDVFGLANFADRTPGNPGAYPDDIQAALQYGRWIFTHKDGRPY